MMRRSHLKDISAGKVLFFHAPSWNDFEMFNIFCRILKQTVSSNGKHRVAELGQDRNSIVTITHLDDIWGFASYIYEAVTSGSNTRVWGEVINIVIKIELSTLYYTLLTFHCCFWPFSLASYIRSRLPFQYIQHPMQFTEQWPLGHLPLPTSFHQMKLPWEFIVLNRFSFRSIWVAMTFR